MSPPGEEEEDLKKRFPHLYRELIAKRHSIAIKSYRSSPKHAEEAASPSEQSPLPDAVDYIRRCGNTEEAEDVITFLEKRAEISKDYADNLRQQLREHGLASFGSRKRWGHYSRQGRG